MLTITGYSDRISVQPGETVKFMVNCEHPTYQADIVRLICADNTPAGPGFKEKLVRTPVSKRHKGRRQIIHAGSYALVESRPLLETLGSFTVQAMIWPTTPGKGEQGIVTKWDSRRKAGFALVIDADGSVALRLGMADGTVETVSIGKPLLERHWYLAAASYDAESGTVTVHQEPLLPYARVDDGGTAGREVGPAAAGCGAPVVMAGIFKRRAKERVLVDGLYNGKIDSPGWSAARWTAWKSSACGTRRSPRGSRPTSSAPGISRATSRRSRFPTAPRITSTAESSTCLRAA